MTFTIRQLAQLVGGELEGDAELQIRAAKPLHEAQAGDITFLDDDKHAAKLQASKASAAVVRQTTPAHGKTVIRVAEPMMAFIGIAQKLHARPPLPAGIDPRAAIDSSATVGPEAMIAAFAGIGAGTTIGARCRIHQGVTIGRDCKLGDDVELHPHVVLYDGCVLGNRVIVHANSVLGADGYGYRLHHGKHVKVPQLGSLEIGSDVEIGACTTIDRAAFGTTFIGDGTKIDNLVQVGHNCRIGKHVLLVSQVGIGGSATIEDYVVFGGQSGIADHKHVGVGARIGAKSGVIGDVAAGAKVFGYPALPDRDMFRLIAGMERLPELRKDVQRIKKALGLGDEARKQAG